MTDEQYNRLVLALERIAYALEIANYRNVVPSTVPVGGGFTCQRCFRWVQPGALHTCNNFAGGYSRSDATSIVKGTITLNPDLCTYVTAANMQCQLPPGHSEPHDLGIGG